MSADEHDAPRRMTISRALEMALLNRQSRQPSVTLTVADGRVTGASVYAAHDDIEEAERQARVVAERIMADYPPPTEQPERHKVSLTRNAKGETQIDLDGKYADETELLAWAKLYETLRARYPLADGLATHDAPTTKGKK